jgi:hypothetical protein
MPGVFGVDATSFARIADVVPIPNALLLQARAMCTMPALPSLQAKDKAHAAPMNNNVSACLDHSGDVLFRLAALHPARTERLFRPLLLGSMDPA